MQKLGTEGKYCEYNSQNCYKSTVLLAHVGARMCKHSPQKWAEMRGSRVTSTDNKQAGLHSDSDNCI